MQEIKYFIIKSILLIIIIKKKKRKKERRKNNNINSKNFLPFFLYYTKFFKYIKFQI